MSHVVRQFVRRTHRALGLGACPDTDARPAPTRDPKAGPPHIERFFFICGLHRSGTTAVEHYISATYKVSFLRAPVSENEGQHLQDVYPPASKYGGPGRFAFYPEMYPPAPSEADTKMYRDRLTAAWSPYIQGDESTLSEKSPPNVTKIPFLRAIFPNARFLIVTRDPRAVAGATQKWSGSSLEELVFHWNVAYAEAIRSLGDDCFLLRYEDFCKDPLGSFARAGLETALERREEPIAISDRFKILENTNGKYIPRHRCPRYGPGSWEYFGYQI